MPNPKINRLDRVIFFSVRDLMRTSMLEKAELLLESQPYFSGMTLNDLLEFHHIQQYFDHDLYLESWTPAQKSVYAGIVKNALNETRSFLIKIIPADLMTEIEELEFDNRGSFWSLIRYFELYKNISNELFLIILKANPHHIREILPLKQLVDHYNTTLRSFLMASDESAELLLSHYEQKNSETSDYYFPKSLTDADKQEIINSYLASEQPNPNYIELIRNSKTLKLSTKTLLKAKQISGELKQEMLSGDNAMELSVGASLNPDQTEPVIYNTTDDHTSVCYGGRFFDSLTNDLQLLSLFSDLFLYTDEEGLITLINKDNEMDVLEKIGMQSKNEYHTGIVFRKKEMLSLSQLAIFDHYLKQKGRSIEEILQNAIHELFGNYFNIENLVFEMPDNGLASSEKIRLLAPEMEYLIKQFKHYVTDQAIDHELLQMDSNPLFYSDLPSLVAKKYIYSNHDSIKIIQHHFFSENSILADRTKKGQLRTLFQKFKAGAVYKTDFQPYQHKFLEQAVETGDLIIAADGLMEITDVPKVIIAEKLHKNGTMSYWHFNERLRVEIDRLIAAGILQTSDRLLNADEISYFNFYLNKKEFTNGMDLRNKYLHGSNNRDAKQQEMDYLYFLRTFILILLKLRDDLLLKRHYDKLTSTGLQ